MCHSEDKHVFGILNTCENVNIELCTRFLSFNNIFVELFRCAMLDQLLHVKHDCCNIY